MPETVGGRACGRPISALDQIGESPPIGKVLTDDVSPGSPCSATLPQKRPLLSEAKSQKGTQQHTPHRPVGVGRLERTSRREASARDGHGDQVTKQTNGRVIHQTAVGRIVRYSSPAQGAGQLVDQLPLRPGQHCDRRGSNTLDSYRVLDLSGYPLGLGRLLVEDECL